MGVQRICAWLLLRHRPQRRAADEADPVVGGDDHQGVVVEAVVPEVVEGLAQEGIGVLELDEVALTTEGGRGVVVPVPELRGPGRVGRLVGPARGQEVPGLVGQEEVAEVQRRPVAGHGLPAEGPEPGGGLGVGRGCGR